MIFPKMGIQMLLFSDRGVQKDLESHLLHVYNFTMNYKMCPQYWTFTFLATTGISKAITELIYWLHVYLMGTT